MHSVPKAAISDCSSALGSGQISKKASVSDRVDTPCVAESSATVISATSDLHTVSAIVSPYRREPGIPGFDAMTTAILREC
eukprot:scaffold34759_cov57-Cyclotella_meneghiniana.AAC.6